MWSVFLFLLAALGIAIAGVRLSKTADRLADKTGLGEAFIGGLFLGAVTSLSGMITSVTAAADGHAALAVSNAIGGIAAQTVFLAIADMTYRKAPLEHASASLQNLLQAALLLLLLGLILFAVLQPPATIFWMHPVSFLLIGVYLLGAYGIHRSKKQPPWKPVETKQTVLDTPEKHSEDFSLSSLLWRFFLLSLIVGVCGYVVGKTGADIVQLTGLSEGIVGVFFTAIATSLPELIVSISAVRRGALDLAVGNIIGGNTFDILFLAFSDLAFTGGSLLHHTGPAQLLSLLLALVLTSILLLGFLYRFRRGVAQIGWMSITLIIVFVLGQSYLVWLG